MKDGNIIEDDLRFKFGSPELEREFCAALDDRVHQWWWCVERGINYTNPDMRMAARCFYHEAYKLFSKMSDAA